MPARWFALVCSLAILPVAAADPCWHLSSPEVTIEQYYADVDFCQPECVAAVWVYEESNGIAGLQRDDPMWAGCYLIAADTLVQGLWQPTP